MIPECLHIDVFPFKQAERRGEKDKPYQKIQTQLVAPYERVVEYVPGNNIDKAY